MTSFGGSFGVERGFVARPPATANLMIDSSDRDIGSSAFDFAINSTNNLQNGFFTRIATSEVCLEWCFPNVYLDLLNRRLNSLARFDISATSIAYTSSKTVTLPNGNYTIKQILDLTVAQLNAAVAADVSGITFSVQQLGNAYITCSGAKFRRGFAGGGAAIDDTTFFSQLSTDTSILTYSSLWAINNPDFRPYRYLDFICEQLTYNQAVKDATTNSVSRDVLCRWYMCEDTQESYDGYGYPILMGYEPFKRRRLFNPPKTLRWNNETPVGNLKFVVYGMPTQVAPGASPQPIVFSGTLGGLVATEWLMTLQLSEN